METGRPGDEPSREHLEISKLDRETKKLDEEIELLRFERQSSRDRYDHEHNHRAREQYRSWAALVLSFATIGSIIAAVAFQLGDYLERKRHQYQFEMSHNLLTLVDQLADEGSVRSENAAILLSAYEEDALPVLLHALGRTERPEPIIESLQLILEKNAVDRDQVLSTLLEEAEPILAKPPTGNETPQMNWIAALGELTAPRQREALDLLESYTQAVVVDDGFGIGRFHRSALCQKLEEACRKLSEQTCRPLGDDGCDGLKV